MVLKKVSFELPKDIPESSTSARLRPKSKKFKKAMLKDQSLLVHEQSVLGHEKIFSFPIETYCKPSQVVSLFNELRELKPLNLQKINDIGFSGLSLMKMTFFHRAIVPWLVQRFDPIGRLFSVDSNKEFVVTPLDCRDVFMLPISNIPVPTNSKRQNHDDYHFVNLLKSHLGLGNDEVSIKCLREKMMTLVDGDAKFLQMFVLYICSTFLSPTANKTIDFSISYALLDISMISSYNWSKFVLDRLCRAISVCKNTSVQGSTILRGRVTGCVLLLQILYFHRFVFQGIKSPTDLPLIQHWDNVNVSQRLKNEGLSGFGSALMDRDTYPISVMHSSPFTSPFVPPPISSTPPLFSELSSIDDNFIHYKIPDHLETNKEIKNKAAHNVDLEALLLFKRDVQVISAIQLERLSQIKERMNSRGNVDSEGPSTLSQMEFSDADLEFIDKSVAQFKAMQEHLQSMPVFEEYLPQHLNAKEDVNKIFEDIQEKPVDDMNFPCANLELKIDEDLRTEFLKETDFFVIKENLCSIFSNFDCGPGDVEVSFISSYMKKNANLMKQLPILQQQLIDFVFSKQKRRSECERLFVYKKKYVVYTNDFLTLQAHNLVSNSIVDCWSTLLNEHLVKKNDDDLRFFFDLSYKPSFVKLLKEGVNDKSVVEALKLYVSSHDGTQYLNRAKLIFLPMLMDEHYYLVVINLDQEKIQVVDNRNYTERGQAKFDMWANVLAESLCKVLKFFKHPCTKDVSSFDIERIPFKSKTNSNVDCSIFMMMAMLLFEGKVFHSDLHDPLRRRLYRSSIGAAILLDDLNEIRDELLAKLEVFNGEGNALVKGKTAVNSKKKR